MISFTLSEQKRIFLNISHDSCELNLPDLYRPCSDDMAGNEGFVEKGKWVGAKLLRYQSFGSYTTVFATLLWSHLLMSSAVLLCSYLLPKSWKMSMSDSFYLLYSFHNLIYRNHFDYFSYLRYLFLNVNLLDLLIWVWNSSGFHKDWLLTKFQHFQMLLKCSWYHFSTNNLLSDQFFFGK